MVASAWAASSYSGVVFSFDAYLATLGAFSAWIALEKSSLGSAASSPSLHPHDVSLGRSLRELFDEKTRRFLRETSVGTPFHNDFLNNLEILADDWVGAEFEFEEAELDNLSSEIVRLARELCNKIAEYAGAAERRPPGYLSVPLQSELAADLFSDRTTANIAELQRLCRALIAEYEKFEKSFRRLAPEVYVSG